MAKLGSKAQDYLHVEGQRIGSSVAGTTNEIMVLMRDQDNNILLSTGTEVPTATTDGYAKGALHIDTNVAAGSSALYENIGTTSSCEFQLVAGGNLSQDLTVAADGVVTIAKINNLASAAEVNRVCDVSARVVSLTGTASITRITHEAKVCVITGTSAANYTLPEATGSGATYRFIINEVNTSNNVFKTADAANCSFFGSVNILDLDAADQAAYAPSSGDDLMTLNGTTTGGAIGDYIEFIDMATDKWMVFGQLQCPTGSNPATPFSGT